MKFNSILVAILIFCTNSICAQQRMPAMGLNEIKAEIEKLESQEEKFRTYVQMSDRYLRNNPDSLLVVAEEIQRLEGIEEDKKTAFASLLAANAWRLMNADSSIYYAERASELLKELNEHSSYLMMENLRAMQLQQRNKYLEAESLYLEAISYREELQAQVDYPIQFFYGNLGNLYVNVGAHDLAIEMYEKFLEYEDNPGSRCNILSKLASSFIELDDIEQAISTLNPCIEIENLPPPIESIVKSNLASMYKMKGDTVQAIQLQEQASRISIQYRIPNISVSQLIKLGTSYMEMNMMQRADSIASLLQKTSTSFSRPNEDIVKYEFLASLELEKGNYAKSIAYADQAIEIAQNNKLSFILMESYAIRADAYEQLGKLDLALANERLQRSHAQQQIDRREERSRVMMTVRYQLQNKEDQLSDATLALKNIRFRNMAIIFGLILIAGYIFYRYRLFYLLKEEKTRNQIARDLHDDLSGTLSSISFFSEAAKRVQKDPKESQRFLDIITESASESKEKINDIIWAIDPSKDDWSVFLKKCKRFAADVLESNDIDYQLEIGENFDFPVELEVRQNLWLIFKECITNLSKHSNASRAAIILKQTGNKVHLEISDNGIGFDPYIIKNGHGLDNIQYRAEAINGTFNLTTSPGEGTKWVFEFDVKLLH